MFQCAMKARPGSSGRIPAAWSRAWTISPSGRGSSGPATSAARRRAAAWTRLARSAHYAARVGSAWRAAASSREALA